MAVDVDVDAIVSDAVIVAVHVHGNDTVGVIGVPSTIPPRAGA